MYEVKRRQGQLFLSCGTYTVSAEWIAASDYDALLDDRDRLAAELAENEGVIRVWRRRAEQAEAELSAARAAAALNLAVEYCNAPDEKDALSDALAPLLAERGESSAGGG